jgi:hypothetical protein
VERRGEREKDKEKERDRERMLLGEQKQLGI